MEHTLTAKGAAFDPETRERVDPTGLGGIGHALCSCGWLSEPLPSGKQRINAHKAHKAEMAALPADESTEGDLPAEQPAEAEKQVKKPLPTPKVDDPWGPEYNASKDEETAAKSGPDGQPNDPEQNTPGSDFAEPVEDTVPAVKGPFQAQRTFPGNYSIVMAPFAQLMADASGLWSEAETFKGRLERRVTFAGEQADVEAFLPVLDHEVEASLAALHIWQKEHREERRGQTDMQKFLANRGFLARFGEEAADRIRNS
jgi:hypothetical protein